MSLTADPRALIFDPAGIKVQSLKCAAAIETARSSRTNGSLGNANALDPDAIRIFMWNIHKEEDAGWQDDLTRFAQSNDVLLLQEVTLLDSLQEILRIAGLRWIMASSFIYEDADIGVLTATRVIPVANCTQRVVEPLLGIPKSTVISWLRLGDTTQTLAIANVHAINFTLTLGTYRAQFAALADVLAEHKGPIVLGGDLNTWTVERAEVLREISARLGLIEIPFADDRRALFLGRQVDHVFVRGLDVVAARVSSVKSSDHTPIEVVLRLSGLDAR